MSNTVRVYNLSFEQTGEGIPLRVDYAGTSYIFQPSDASYDFVTVQSRMIDRGAQVAITGSANQFVKREENDLPGYLDVGAGVASYIFAKGYGRDKGILKSGDEMQDIVDQQLRKKQAALEAVEKELEIAEKKAASKKKPKSRSTTKLYSDVQA